MVGVCMVCNSTGVALCKNPNSNQPGIVGPSRMRRMKQTPGGENKAGNKGR